MMLLTVLMAFAGVQTAGADGLSGSGTAADPYLISSAEDWTTFANAVYGGTTYEGQIVKLTADIGTAQDPITTMAGTSDYKFRGTFIGDGHTLTVKYTATTDGCAPFLYIYGATIKYLKVAGTISTGYKYAAGIAAHSSGNSTIKNCWSNVTIKSTVSGDGTHGGLVAVQEDGSLNITNCLFDGSITGSNTNNCGGFVGWRNDMLTFTNCLMAATMDISQTDGSALFSRNNNPTLTNCYYDGSKSYGSITVQGTSTTATGSALQALLGSEWEVSGDQAVPIMNVKNLNLATVSGVNPRYFHTGSAISITPVVTSAAGTTLTPGTDYTVTIKQGDDAVPSVTDVGNYTLTITGTGTRGNGYYGSKSVTFNVVEKLSGSGTKSSPYLIGSIADWTRFTNAYFADTYWASGVYVKLTADIGTAQDPITTMAGTSDHKFKGTFTGDGHTLTVNYTATADGCAPFLYIDGATIKYLKVAGTITTDSYKYAAGIAAHSYGNSTIKNCWSNVAIETTISDDGTHGGLVAVLDAGSLSITDCLFDGSITGSNTTNCGGFVGWRGATLTFNNCLMAGTMAISQTDGSALFNRNGGSTLTNCYYDGSKSYGSIKAQGTSTTAMGETLRAQLGSEWEVSGDKVVPIISSRNLTTATVSGVNTGYFHTGSAISITPVVTNADGTTLTPGTDYTVTIKQGDDAVPSVTDVGNYTLTITGTGTRGNGYYGSKSVTFNVVEKLSGSGTKSSPYLIGSIADWTRFTNAYFADTYWASGVYVKLTADIGTAQDPITTMAGTSDHKFKGTFTGDGYTLTVNYTAVADGCAPFLYIEGATIKYLKVAGTITTGYKYAAGIAAHSYGNSAIQYCWSNVTITTTVDGDGTHGGLVAALDGGSLSIGNSLFDGSITGGSTTNCGGFVGWRGATLTFNNCLMAGTMAISQTDGSALFNRNGGSTLTNCYYDGSKSYGSITVQGTSTTATGSDLQALLGSGWEVSGGLVVPIMNATNLAIATISGVNTRYLYNGSAISITPVVTDAAGTTLTPGTDYTVTIKKGNDVVTSITAAGSYTLTITGTGIRGNGYYGSKSVTFNVIEVLLGSGTMSSPYLIGSIADWTRFTNADYADIYCASGVYIKLTADIGTAQDPITTMAGTGSYKFKGTFIGDDHTLTVNYMATADGCAPFLYIDGAIITTLKVAGTISTGYKNAAGIAAHSYGNSTIQNCWSNVAIATTVDGDGTHGGLVAAMDGGSLSIGNSLFDGSITGSNTTNCAGFVGYRKATLTFTNCFQNGTLSLKQASGSATFNRNGGSMLTNCYYRTAYGDVQGQRTNATGSDLQALLGSGWTVSGDKVVPVTNAANIGTAIVSGLQGYYEYTGNDIGINYTVTAVDGTTLTKGTDFTESISPATVKDKGGYTLTITGTGNYSGSQTLHFTVGDLSVDDGYSFPDPGRFYVNMPQTGTKTVTLTDACITAFKVYDDGGLSGKYSNDCNGTLVLTAPVGYLLRLSGSITTEHLYDYLTVYDGSTTSTTTLLDKVRSTFINHKKDIPTVTSKGQSMTLYFYSNESTISGGLDLTVNLVDANADYVINGLGSGTGGTVAASVGGESTTTAKCSEVVTLTATPENNYMLSSVSVVDTDGMPVAVDLNSLMNTATFTMPPSAVTVTPIFTNDLTAAGGLYVNMPKTGSKSVTIPFGVQSFKVYDDGGANGNYSVNCDGTLVLTAPANFVLQLSGTITTRLTGDDLTVYDGSTTSAPKLLNKVSSTGSGTQTDITTVFSTGPSMTLCFKSGNSNYAGLDLTVTLILVSAINGLGTGTGGTIAASLGNRSVTQAKDDDVVTLTTTTGVGYQLSSISVVDANNNPVAVTWDGPSDNTATFTMPASEVTVTATWTDMFNMANGADGSAENPYVISSADGWNFFCDALQDNTTYDRFSGKTVTLGEDIGSAQEPITRMAGSSGHDFCGTFDGGGNTLTFATTGSVDGVAPFSYVNETTPTDGSEVSHPAIRNLNVVVDITSTATHASGLVGRQWGTLTIEGCTVGGTIQTSATYAAGFIGEQNGVAYITDCVSSVTIKSSINGDGTHGGFIGHTIDATCIPYIEGCLFNGKLLSTGTNATNKCGGFVGWNGGSLANKVLISNSLYAPATLAVGETWVSSDGSATFCLNGATITNSYYTAALGTKQGKAAHTVTAGQNVILSHAGEATEYDVSGITAYKASGASGDSDPFIDGIVYDGVLYGGSGDQVSLTLANTATAPLGYEYTYTASPGTLDGTTLIMPNADVTVSLGDLALIDWAKESEGTQADPYMIYNKEQLDMLAQRVSGGETFSGKTFMLGSDIAYDPDVLTIDHNGDGDFDSNYTPIGNEDHHFSGSFYGRGYSISGLHYDNASSGAGLFGQIDGGVVDGVTLVSPTFKADGSVGGIVGTMSGGTISNCTVVNGSLDGGSGTAVGIIVGKNGNGALTISGCTYHTAADLPICGEGSYTDGGGNQRVYQLTLDEGITATGTPAVSLGGYDYYTSGSTVTLSGTPTAPVGYLFNAYTVKGSPIDGTSFTMSTKDVSVSVKWAPDPAHFSVNDAGTEYTIHTATGWGVFCDCLSDKTYSRFSGKTVMLGADISVRREANLFFGSFDGQGHTLNFAITTEDNNVDGIAPFYYIETKPTDINVVSPPAIRNLNVVAAITTGRLHASGLVGRSKSITIEGCTVSGTIRTTSESGAAGFIGGLEGNTDVTITNCVSSITIINSKDGTDDSSNGGFVGTVGSKHTLHIEGSLFNGKLLTTNSNTRSCGGFVGKNEGTVTVTNCLYAPAAPADGETWENTRNSATFVRNYSKNGFGGVSTITNCYYTKEFNDGTQLTGQGKEAYSAGAAPVGEPIANGTYSVSGITAYANGLMRGETFYYGGGDNVSVSFVNENGGNGSHEAIALDKTMNTLDAGWYYVGKDISYTQSVTLTGDANIILADGKTMTTSGNSYGIDGSSDGSLTIYGQALGTGILNATSIATNGIGIYTDGIVTINGGKVNANGTNDVGIRSTDGVTINRGTITTTGIMADGDVTINGGKFTATDDPGICSNSGTVTLGWTSADDFIKADSYSGVTVMIADGQSLHNGSEVLSGIITDMNKLEEETLIGVDVLQDAATNDITALATRLGGKQTNVVLQDRKLWKDGDWNTLCLPFDLGDPNASNGHHFDGTPLEGATLMTLGNSPACNTGFNAQTSTLSLDFLPATTVEAGVPYIVKWGNTEGTEYTENPVFTGVTVTTDTPADHAVTSADDYVTFVGTYSPADIYAAPATRLYLGDDNKLYYPTATDFKVNAFRAYFQLNGLTCGSPIGPEDPYPGSTNVRAFNLSFGDGEASGIVEITDPTPSPSPAWEGSAAWYSLDGVRLDGKPTKKGLYIHGGRKVVVK